MYRRLFVSVNPFQARHVRERRRNETTGCQPVYHRFISRTRNVLRSWLLTSVPTPICLRKPFSCNACPGKGEFTGRLQSPDIPPPDWGRKAHGRAARLGRMVPSQFGSARKHMSCVPTRLLNAIILNLPSPKPGHTTGRSGRGGARRGSRAARGWIGRHAVGSIRQENNPRSCPPANQEHSLESVSGSTNNLNS